MELDETRIGRLEHKIEKLQGDALRARRRGDAQRRAQRPDRACASSSARRGASSAWCCRPRTRCRRW